MSFELDKPDKSGSRLRLIRNTNEKSGCILSCVSEKHCNEKPIIPQELASPNTDDSLGDFKSPKLNSKGFQTNQIQILRDSSTKNVKHGKKKYCKNKINGDSKHLKSGTPSGLKEKSIQSLFFKAPREKSTFLCPLCLKAFADSHNQAIHAKNCATKNNVSTEKLLAAVELQEKQIKERRAIGLPTGPCARNSKKKCYQMKKLSPQNDPDIELALALSISLNEVEKIEEFENAASAVETNEELIELTLSPRKSTLQSFGFSTNKPITEAINQKKKRKLLYPTVLQTRTQETRERILTERISEILVGFESITQQKLEENKLVIETNIKFMGVQNEELKKWFEPSANLWSRSQYNCHIASYYVDELSKFIIPAESHKIGDGNNVTEKENAKIKLNEAETCKAENGQAIIRKRNKFFCNNFKDFRRFNDSLKNDWSQMVDNSYLSDVGIFVKDNNFIHAHNLVIWTRCQLLTNDYQTCNHNSGDDHHPPTMRYEIHWPYIDHNVAIIFLNYLYCADIPSSLICDRKIHDQIKLLGEKYQVTKLLEFLEDSNNQSFNNEEMENDEQISANHDHSMSTEESNAKYFLMDHDEPLHCYSKVNQLDEEINDRSLNSSPDLFDDTKRFEYHSETSIASLPSDIIENDEIQPSIITTDPHTDISFSHNPHHVFDGKKKLSNVRDAKNIITKNSKSNLSFFIDKIKRQQARYILESDTDGDTPLKNCKLHQNNPFKVCVDANDSLYSWKSKECDKTNITFDPLFDVHGNVKTQLTLLEEEIHARGLKKTSLKRNEVLSNINSETILEHSVGSLDESMYTKYIKKRNETENSIDEYRDALKCMDDSKKVIGELLYDNSTPESEEETFNKPLDSVSVILSPTYDIFNKKCKEDIEASAVSVGELFNSDFEISNSFSVSEKNRPNRNINHDNNILEKDTSMSNFSKYNNSHDFQKDFETSSQSKLTQTLVIVSSSDAEHCNTSNIEKIKTTSQISSKPTLQEDNSAENSKSLRISEGQLNKWALPNDQSVSLSTDLFRKVQTKENNLRSIVKVKDIHHDDSNNKTEFSIDKNITKNYSTSKNRSKRIKVPTSFQISYNMSPPIDYNGMESSDLGEELNKYGLKPQTKHRAIQLLQHIYNELHPSVPADIESFRRIRSSDSENEEPPSKKQQLNSDNMLEETIIYEQDSDEEMKIKLNQAVNCDSRNRVVNIKQAFNKLLVNNKDIFNKVLTYESLPLELLYEKLINQGFKGKINEVISFLDDECITFQVLGVNRNKKKKR